MKNLTKSELKIANKIANNFFFSPFNMLMDRNPKFDRRTRIGKKAHLIFKDLKKSVMTTMKLIKELSLILHLKK